jgi:hypothetical protein
VIYIETIFKQLSEHNLYIKDMYFLKTILFVIIINEIGKNRIFKEKQKINALYLDLIIL